MVEDIVATVNAIVPPSPDIRQDGVGRILLEVVQVITVLRGNSHGLQQRLIGAVSQLTDEEAALALELGIAGVDTLVEIGFGLIEVAFGNVVARILSEESVTARGGGSHQQTERKNICYLFHIDQRLKFTPMVKVRESG